MKKAILMTAMMMASVTISAQLNVDRYGRVSIFANPSAKLSVGQSGGERAIYVLGGHSPLYVERSGNCAGPMVAPAIESLNNPYSYYYSVAVKGRTHNSTPINDGRAFGVMGHAGNTTSGYNYGVAGFLEGNQNGASIYGSTESDYGVNVGGRYAGYFNGDVKVTGTLYAPVLTTTAASANVATAQVALATAGGNEASVSDKLAQLSAYSYNIQLPMPLASKSSASTATRAMAADTLSSTFNADTVEVAFPSDIELQALEKNHYGLMAAQLQQIYPDLVYENQNGDLCINYIEMIPLLVESIKELKAEIATLQSGDNGGAVVMSRAIEGAGEEALADETALTIPMLEQNDPNPFTASTRIAYTLPETVQTAHIYIYDMNGTQIEQIPLHERGRSSVTIDGGRLKAGMYLYSLIADGKVIDTKRMILTK